MRSCSSPLCVGLAEREHLDLVELVHAEDAARVLAVRAGFAPEAGGVPAVARRQLLGRERLAAMQRRQRDLARAEQEQLAVVDVVHLGAVGREEARFFHRALAHERGRDHGHEAVPHDRAHRVVDERELEQRAPRA